MNDKLLKEFKKLLLNELFPIGKTEIFYDSNDHSNYLGFTWERTALDRFIKGYSPSANTITSTGGEKTHTLTIDEIPSHNHFGTSAITANNKNRLVLLGEDGAVGRTYIQTLNTGSDFGFRSSVMNGLGYSTISAVGGDQPHNNEPQFQVFAIWRRVS